MKAAILITGNEILSGQIHESNSYYMAKELNKMGIEVISFAVLPDEVATIAGYVRKTSPKVDYLFVCGGIGSTHDDVTRPAIAKAVGKSLKSHPEFVERLKRFYKERCNAARLRMAELPEGSKLITPRKYPNAPGFSVKNIYVFAGIPELMKDMFVAVAKTIKRLPIFTIEIPTDKREGDFADNLHGIQRQFRNVKIGSYPHFWMKKLGGRIVLRGRNKREVTTAARNVREMLAKI